MASSKRAPRPQPTHPDVGKVVWVTCRSDRPCGSNQVTVVMKSKNPTGGWSVRYKCNHCGGSFFINT